MELKKVIITENQRKVIQDKYLKDSPSVEAWLDLVATNVALADLLYSQTIREEEIFNGINYEIEGFDTIPGQKTRALFLHKNFQHYDEWDKNFKRFIENLYKIAETEDGRKVIEPIREKFYNMLSNFEFLPNSPTLMNAGRKLQQLSACYVLPVGDSIEEIFDSVKHAAMIHKSGGGTGFSFSRLRPTNDPVKSTHGVASGPLTFMQIFDKQTDVIKQGGTRRGANMGILRYDHPNIIGFINMKKTPGLMENFNVSVAIDKHFMDKVKMGEDYELKNPKTKEAVGKLNAKDVWDLMIKGAWETGDPGFVVIDRINETNSNPTPHIGEIESTNPCGEQPLLPYEPCNLGSINLSKFVKEDSSDMNFERLAECTFDCVHFLDNVIEVNNYPLPQIEKIAKENRRIGLGVMGWAETLVMLGIPYNSKEAFKKAEQLMKCINDAAMAASEELASVRGIFPNWKNSIFDKNGNNFRGQEAYPRNCARTTIAPTGTIGITAGLQGAGIEPFFAIAYTRYNAAGIDALKREETPADKDTFFEVNPLFRNIAEKDDYFGFEEKELWKRIEENHKSVIGIKEIPERIQNLFLTSHDLSPLDHVNMQCAFQRYTDNAVSKTVNLRNEATTKDVEEVYIKAYELGAKGVTIYRDGSKQFQILNISDKTKKKEKKKMGYGERSDYYEISTGQGPLHVHVNYDEDGPTKVFANISPIGTEISGLTTALGIMLSKYLENGGDPIKLIKHLNSVKGDKPFGFGPNKVDSIPHAISKVIRDHLRKTGKLKYLNGQTILNGQATLNGKSAIKNPNENNDNLYCPKCYSTNVEMVSGCSEPTCFDCGYSECS